MKPATYDDVTLNSEDAAARRRAEEDVDTLNADTGASEKPKVDGSISADAASDWEDVAPTRVIDAPQHEAPPHAKPSVEQRVIRPREPMVTVGRQRNFDPDEVRVGRATLVGVAPVRTPLPLTPEKDHAQPRAPAVSTRKKDVASATPPPGISTRKKDAASATPLPGFSMRKRDVATATPLPGISSRKRDVASATPLPAAVRAKKDDESAKPLTGVPALKTPLPKTEARTPTASSSPDSSNLPTTPLKSSPIADALDRESPAPREPQLPPTSAERHARLPLSPVDAPVRKMTPDPLPVPESPPSVPPPLRSQRTLWLMIAIVPVAAALGVWIESSFSHRKTTSDITRARDKAVAAATAQAPTVSAAEPASTSPATTSLSPLDRVAAGDPSAMEAVSSRTPEDRRLAETVALAKGHRVIKRHEIEQYRAKLLEQPDLLKNRGELRKLRSYVEDREIAVEALSVIADLPGPIGPDMLYDLWIGNPKRTETTMLAEELVYSEEVRAKASPALAVALDLRAAKSCESVVDILPRALQYADKRASSSLKKLLIRRGCGQKRVEDCYACLRPLDHNKKAVNVLQALIRSRTRRPPVLK
jgi:hypothetical protein